MLVDTLVVLDDQRLIRWIYMRRNCVGVLNCVDTFNGFGFRYFTPRVQYQRVVPIESTWVLRKQLSLSTYWAWNLDDCLL